VTIRRGVIESLEDLKSLVLGDVIAIHDWEDKFPTIQIALQNDTDQWVLAGRNQVWTTETLYHTIKEENLHMHLMRRA